VTAHSTVEVVGTFAGRILTKNPAIKLPRFLVRLFDLNPLASKAAGRDHALIAAAQQHGYRGEQDDGYGGFNSAFHGASI